MSCSCDIWFRFLSIGIAVTELYIIQGILIMRLHAIYSGSKWILYGLLVLYLVNVVTGSLVVSLAMRNVKVTAHPTPELNACTPLSDFGFLWVLW